MEGDLMKTVGWIFVGWLIGQFFYIHSTPRADDFSLLRSNDVEVLLRLERQDADKVLKLLAKHRLDQIKSSLWILFLQKPTLCL